MHDQGHPDSRYQDGVERWAYRAANDLATAGGAVAGAYAGSTIGRGDKATPQTQEVQRCSDVAANEHPDHWDVTYVFQGQEHRAQMASPPGATITVNAQGEPRI